MRGLSGIACFGQEFARRAVQFSQARPMGTHAHCLFVDMSECFLEPPVLKREVSRAKVLRVVAPVPVRADPDLEERGLVFLDGPITGRGERPNRLSRPNEGVAECEIDLALPT